MGEQPQFVLLDDARESGAADAMVYEAPSRVFTTSRASEVASVLVEADAARLGAFPAPRAAIYDGDTSPSQRKRLREDPPQILVTNPDMLHLGILPHHASWAAFFRGLKEATSTKTPAVPGVETRKVELGPRGAEVVAHIF